MLARHLQQVRSKDLHSLVMPPAEGPLKCQRRASPAWMAKVAGLCWDLVHDVARNSKINSSKLQPAILGLLKAGQIENLSGKKEKEFAESIDSEPPDVIQRSTIHLFIPIEQMFEHTESPTDHLAKTMELSVRSGTILLDRLVELLSRALQRREPPIPERSNEYKITFYIF